MASKFCKHCTAWDGGTLRRVDGLFGICNNNQATSKIIQDGLTKINEDNTVWTEEYMGCIYHSSYSGALFSTDDIVNDEI